jgi:hypothetical protein
MTLPTTLVEAEALEFAHQHIAYVKGGKLKLWGIISGRWFDGGESERVCRLMLAQWALRDAANLMDAVQFARAGFELWEDVLRNLLLEYKNQNRTEQMPTYLRAYDMELTRGASYSRRSGRHRADQLLRNLVLAVIIAMVIERFELRPTRNIASSRPSACSVVARALELEGMAMSEPAVVQIWKTDGRHVKEMRGLAMI